MILYKPKTIQYRKISVNSAINYLKSISQHAIYEKDIQMLNDMLKDETQMVNKDITKTNAYHLHSYNAWITIVKGWKV